MVQFIFTPWRDRAELLHVRSQFYPSSSSTTTTTTTNDSTTTAATKVVTTIIDRGGDDDDDQRQRPRPRLPWSTPEELRDVERAIARVFMWVHRGHCPHVVESTALLTAAIVFDEEEKKKKRKGGHHGAVEGAAVRAGYLMGFTRFVTGLLDSHQDKARKLSMYGVAKTIGLPASFVELRHQGTHEPMPSLTQLRPAARMALGWIWEYYWKNLPPGEEEGEAAEEGGLMDDVKMRDVGHNEKEEEEDEEEAATTPATTTAAAAAAAKKGRKRQVGSSHTATTTTTTASSRSSGLQERMCRGALMGYLQRQEGDVGGSAAKEGLMRQLKQWDAVLVAKVLADVGGSARDRGLLFRSVKLSRELLGRDPGEAPGAPSGGGEEVEEEWRQELVRAREEAEDRARGTSAEEPQHHDEEGRGGGGTGWFEWKGPWTPRPIGCL